MLKTQAQLDELEATVPIFIRVDSKTEPQIVKDKLSGEKQYTETLANLQRMLQKRIPLAIQDAKKNGGCTHLTIDVNGSIIAYQLVKDDCKPFVETTEVEMFVECTGEYEQGFDYKYVSCFILRTLENSYLFYKGSSNRLSVELIEDRFLEPFHRPVTKCILPAEEIARLDKFAKSSIELQAEQKYLFNQVSYLLT